LTHFHPLTLLARFRFPGSNKLFLILFIALTVTLLVWSHATERLNYIAYDYALKNASFKINKKIVIIAIDEKSLRALGKWPWRRRIHAQLLEKLAQTQPQSVGLDIIFSELSQNHPKDDLLLTKAIRQLGNVTLPVFFMPETQQSSLTDILPLPELRKNAKNLGHVQIELDSDGIARGFFALEGLGDTYWPAFSYAVTGVPLAPNIFKIKRISPNHEFRKDYQRIPFSKNSLSVTTYSYVDVLNGLISTDHFKNKIILIGATAAGLGDLLPTPISDKAAPTPGVVIHANAISGLLNHNMIYILSTPWIIFISILGAVIPLLFFDKVTSSQALLISLAAALLFYLFSSILLITQTIWLPPASGIIGILITYPLWSRQKLIQLHQFLNEELTRLHAEPTLGKIDSSSLNSNLLLDQMQIYIPTTASISSIPKSAEKTARQIFMVRQALDSMRDMQKLITRGFNQMPDGIIVTDTLGQILFASKPACQWQQQDQNSEASLLHDKNNQLWTGLNISDFLKTLSKSCSDSQQNWDVLIHQVLIDRISVNRELNIHQNDILIQFKPAFLEEKSNLGIIINFSDITHIKKRQREKDRLIGFLSHDVRSPLVSQLAILERIKNKKLLCNDEVIDRLSSQAIRSLSLAEQFLQVARAEQLKEDSFQECEVTSIVENSIDGLRPDARSKNIKFNFNFSENIWIKGSPELLERAFSNLINNAIKYSSENSTVTIDVQKQKHLILINFSDKGKGIEKALISKLFLPFQRLNIASDQKIRGSGLGLYFVKTVMEKHGGSVAVRSKPGIGSRFVLSIPVN